MKVVDFAERKSGFNSLPPDAQDLLRKGEWYKSNFSKASWSRPGRNKSGKTYLRVPNIPGVKRIVELIEYFERDSTDTDPASPDGKNRVYARTVYDINDIEFSYLDSVGPPSINIKISDGYIENSVGEVSPESDFTEMDNPENPAVIADYRRGTTNNYQLYIKPEDIKMMLYDKWEIEEEDE